MMHSKECITFELLNSIDFPPYLYDGCNILINQIDLYMDSTQVHERMFTRNSD